MSVSIRPCPSCHSMLLGDSAQCPLCGHILDAARASEFMELIPQEELGSSDDEEPCRQCGEMVRIGLVRCWSCGAFMNPEMEAAYREMQASPPPIVYSQGPPVEETHAPEPAPVDTPVGDDDDGFVMSVGAYDPEDDFAVSPDVATEDPYSRAQPAADDDYELAPGGQDSDYELSPPEQYAEEPTQTDAEGGYALQEQHSEYAPPEEAPPEEYAEEYQPEGEAAEAAESAESTEAPTEVPHSVSTGGDVLLAAALQEEREQATRPKRNPRSRRGAPVPPGSFLVFCPNGHRIQVQDRHRGRAGRCPQCKGLFFVPAPIAPAEAPADAAAAAPAAGMAGGFRAWILDLHLHTVNPTKLKLKVGSLQAEYETADVGFSETEMLVATVYKGGGAFRAMQEAKKKAPVRQAVLEHLAGGQPLDQLPALKHLLLTAAEMPQLKIVQPAAVDEESIFAGVAVFGSGRIAVRLPVTAGAIERQYLSFSLTEFREFSRWLGRFGMENFGQELGIPLGDQFDELKCHYSDTQLHVIENVDYYKADPKFKVVLIGRRCAGCGLVVSEDARKKEKIGGASGSGIAKAICPKCKKKFGDLPLYGVESAEKTPAASGGAKA